MHIYRIHIDTQFRFHRSSIPLFLSAGSLQTHWSAKCKTSFEDLWFETGGAYEMYTRGRYSWDYSEKKEKVEEALLTYQKILFSIDALILILGWITYASISK